jgi:hypothetical protein
MARKSRRSARRSARKAVRVIRRTVTKYRRVPSAGGLTPFRGSGSLLSRARASLVPGARAAAAALVGAWLGGKIAERAMPITKGSNAVEAGVVGLGAVAAAAYGPRLARRVPMLRSSDFVALGLGLGMDAMLRATEAARKAGRIPLLAATAGRRGLLAGLDDDSAPHAYYAMDPVAGLSD